MTQIDEKNETLNMEEIADAAMETIKPGVVIDAEIVTVDSDYAYVNVGSKSDGRVPLSEFREKPGVGDRIGVMLKSTRLNDGLYECSMKAAEQAVKWEKFIESYDKDSGIIYGKVIASAAKGKIVECGDVTGFLPFSLAADLKSRDSSDEVAFAVKSIDRKKRSLLLSRKDYLDEYQKKNWDAFVEKYKQGDKVCGKVVKFVEFGAFVRIDGVDALVHRNDMSWKKVFKQRKILKLGEEYEFLILAINVEDQKVSLSLKDLVEDPWLTINTRYASGNTVSGTVVTLTNFGAFIEIEDGIEGFLSNTELSWNKAGNSVNDYFSRGDVVEVKILDINSEEKKLSLGRKQLLENPWEKARENYPVGSVHTKPIKKIVKFGLFVALDQHIDGLIHSSDISWEGPVNLQNDFKQGQEVEFKILTVNVDEQKISCGIKQLTRSPWEAVKQKYPPRTKVNGVITSIKPFGLFVKLEDNIEGLVHISEVSRKRIENLEEHFTIGDRVAVIVLGVDVERKRLSLSIKSHDMLSEKEELDRIMQDTKPGKFTLGDMMKINNDGDTK